MIDPLELMQTTLDTLLAPSGVQSFWQQKTEATGRAPNEYVVYTLDEDEAIFADDAPLTRTANIAVRYYYRENLRNTPDGRKAVRARATAILSALQEAGFSVPNGAVDIGDIDDVGFGVILIECYLGRVV